MPPSLSVTWKTAWLHAKAPVSGPGGAKVTAGGSSDLIGLQREERQWSEGDPEGGIGFSKPKWIIPFRKRVFGQTAFSVIHNRVELHPPNY